MLKNEKLGIPFLNPIYIQVLPGQDPFDEIMDIQKFIKDELSKTSIPELKGAKSFKFINYGRAQLVYVLNVEGDTLYTLIVNQPATRFGVGRDEFLNLEKLYRNNPNNVIKPLYYLNNSKRELYVTPYEYQARCLGVNYGGWGVWVPEPDYHFSLFNEDDKRIINICVIAMLINMYNSEIREGIGNIYLDGGDFMLPANFEKEKITEEAICNNLKLVAAREMLKIDLEEYIDILRYELLGMSEKHLILARRLRCPFTKEEIEVGINLGRSFIKQKILIRK